MLVQHAVLAFVLIEEERQGGRDRPFAGGRDEARETGGANGCADALDVVVPEG
jgi:hypothetical protein